jgi:hypothetical protein
MIDTGGMVPMPDSQVIVISICLTQLISDNQSLLEYKTLKIK